MPSSVRERDRARVRDRVGHVDQLERRTGRASICSPVATSSSSTSRSLCSSSLERAIAIVSGPPYTGGACVGTELAQDPRQRAEVVLVAVGDDDRLDVLGALAQVGEVRQHEVDAEHVGGREAQAGVDDDDPARRTRRPSCSCRSRPGRRAAGRAAAGRSRRSSPGACRGAPASPGPTRVLARRRARRTAAAASPTVDADHVQRRLERARGRRDRHVAVDVLQPGVDLAPAARARRPSGASRRRTCGCAVRMPPGSPRSSTSASMSSLPA